MDRNQCIIIQVVSDPNIKKNKKIHNRDQLYKSYTSYDNTILETNYRVPPTQVP